MPDSLITIGYLPSTISEVSFGSQIKNLPALNTATITKVTISEENQNLTVDGNCIYDKNKTILKTVWGQPVSISISEEVQTIGSSAISGQTKLITILLPDSVETIETNAFSGCTSLTSIYLGNSLKKIGARVFANCSSLTSIEIPGTIDSIDADAFGNWPQAKTIYIHKKKGTIPGMPWGANIGDRAIIWDE